MTKNRIVDPAIGLPLNLTAAEAQQLVHGNEFALISLRKVMADTNQTIWSAEELRQSEVQIMALTEKLLDFYYKFGA